MFSERVFSIGKGDGIGVEGCTPGVVITTGEGKFKCLSCKTGRQECEHIQHVNALLVRGIYLMEEQTEATHPKYKCWSKMKIPNRTEDLVQILSKNFDQRFDFSYGRFNITSGVEQCSNDDCGSQHLTIIPMPSAIIMPTSIVEGTGRIALRNCNIYFKCI